MESRESMAETIQLISFLSIGGRKKCLCLMIGGIHEIPFQSI